MAPALTVTMSMKYEVFPVTSAIMKGKATEGMVSGGEAPGKASESRNLDFSRKLF